MTVYDIQAVNGGTGTDYEGCFRDALPRAMPGDPLVFDAMTNKVGLFTGQNINYQVFAWSARSRFGACLWWMESVADE